MRRYLPLLCLSFFMIIATLIGLTYLSGYANHQHQETIKTITLYTTLPIEQVSLISQEFEKINKIKINMIFLPEQELLTRLSMEQNNSRADVILANRSLLEHLKQKQLLAAFSSEQTDMVPERFSDGDNFWIGIWYDPVVFAVNRDYLQKQPLPRNWNELLATSDAKRPRLAVTDFLAAEASANLLYTLVANHGETETMNFLKEMHPQIIQYAKFLATPVRMAGLGECDIAIAMQSEAIRYVNNGFPITIAYPEDGTAFLLTGAGIPGNSPHKEDALLFIDWLLDDEAQWILQKNHFFFVPVNPESHLIKNLAMKNLVLLDQNISNIQEQQKLLSYWVQNVRLASGSTK